MFLFFSLYSIHCYWWLSLRHSFVLVFSYTSFECQWKKGSILFRPPKNNRKSKYFWQVFIGIERKSGFFYLSHVSHIVVVKSLVDISVDRTITIQQKFTITVFCLWFTTFFSISWLKVDCLIGYPAYIETFLLKKGEKAIYSLWRIVAKCFEIESENNRKTDEIHWYSCWNSWSFACRKKRKLKPLFKFEPNEILWLQFENWFLLFFFLQLQFVDLKCITIPIVD